jgi:hypothetical protein
MNNHTKKIIEISVLLLGLALWLFNKPSSVISLLIISVFGVIGVLGAILINMSFPETNRFLKYFLNTIWIGVFILVSTCYFVFTNTRFSSLTLSDKLTFSSFVSLIITLFTFPFEYIFFSLAFILLVNIYSKK